MIISFFEEYGIAATHLHSDEMTEFQQWLKEKLESKHYGSVSGFCFIFRLEMDNHGITIPLKKYFRSRKAVYISKNIENIEYRKALHSKEVTKLFVRNLLDAIGESGTCRGVPKDFNYQQLRDDVEGLFNEYMK